MAYDGKATCGGCAATWTGTGRAHCRGCCRTFAGVGLFDRHREQDGERGTCLDPVSLVDRAGEPVMRLRNGVWSGPEASQADRERLAELKSARKASVEGRK